MPIILNDTPLFVRQVILTQPLQAKVFLEDSTGTEAGAFDITFTGNGNYVADAYDAILALPEYAGASLDTYDLAPEFPGSGGACVVHSEKSLADHKAEAKERINQAWKLAESSGFEAFGKVFDSDNRSIQRLYGAAQAAGVAKMAGQPLNITWTCKDNSTLAMDADMLVQLPIFIAQAGAQLHAKCQALKVQIASATSISELEGIVW